jgi:hypothetical protein
MSTQQEIAAWQAALSQKQQEKTTQQQELATQRAQQAAAATAKNNATIALKNAIDRGAPESELTALVDRVDAFEDAEINAKLAADQTDRKSVV